MLKKINNIYSMLIVLKNNIFTYSIILLITVILIAKEIFIFDEEIIVAFNFILIIYLFYNLMRESINSAILARQNSIFNVINNAILTNEYFLKSNIYSLKKQQNILNNIELLKVVILTHNNHLLKITKDTSENNINNFVTQSLEDFKAEEQNILQKDFKLFIRKAINYIQNSYDKS